jgi:peptidase E
MDNSELLFVPTASGDAEGYCRAVRRAYENLGCSASVLRLVENPDDPEAIGEKIDAADAVYVGGGDTDFMLDIWANHEVKDRLRTAGRSGTLLTGLSAGANCWFAGSYDDSTSNDTDFAPTDGLRVPPFRCTPYAGVSDRLDGFGEYVRGREAVGIAIGNGAVFEARTGTDEFRVRSYLDEEVYRVTGAGNGGRKQLPVGEWRPLNELR